MNTNNTPLIVAMLVVMLFFPLLYSLGISVVFLEVFLILVAFVYLNGKKKVKTNSVFLLIVILVFIDKINDIIYSISLSNIGPIIYTICIAFFFANIEGQDEKVFLKVLYRLMIVAVFFNIASCLILSASPIRSLDRDVSAMLMLFSMLNFYYGKRKWLIFLCSAFTCVMILEARTMILSYGAFMAGNYILEKYNNIKLKKLALFVEFAFAFFFIYLGIQSEMVLGPGNNENGIDFSGRGYIWGAVLSSFFEGSFREILFGLPSNPENLRRLFGYDMFEFDSINESVGSILVSGHFHNTIVYYIYNTGIVGLFLLLTIFYKALKRFGFNNENYNIFNALFLVAIFNGKSITSIYILSTLYMIILFIKLPNSKLNYKIC